MMRICPKSQFFDQTTKNSGSYLDVRNSSNVVLRCENEFIVDDPIRLVIEACWRMQLNDLVVLDCQVVTRFFLWRGLVLMSKKYAYLVCNLHEESRNKSLSNVGIVLLWSEFGTSSRKSKSVHNSRELLTNIIGTKCIITVRPPY